VNKMLVITLMLVFLSACARNTPVAPPPPTLAPSVSAPTIMPTTVPSATSTTPLSSNAPRATPIPAPVPSEFLSLYNELDTALTAFDNSLDAPVTPSPVTFATELLPANGNRGTELLNPQAIVGVRTSLDALQKMGVQGVTVAIKYPMLLSDFPNAAQYVEFFKNVANEIHQRHMKMDVEMGAVFPPPISSLDVSYTGLTLDQFKSRAHQMAATIITQVQPDYLDLDAEPDTEAAITRLNGLDTPQTFTDVINAVLKDLNRDNTLVGAGSGSWSGLDFVKSEAANTSLDFISIHVYPVMGQTLPTVATMADIAHQHGKRVILDEMWLYKANTTQPSMSNSSAEMIRLNSYSFWAPLDQKFLAAVARIARAKNIEYISAYWPTTFFAYLDYDPKLQTVPYNQLLAQWNNEVAPSMTAGQYTATGEFYKQLIGGAR
jgi:hypothetical protein